MVPVWRNVSSRVNSTWRYNYYMPARNWIQLKVNPQVRLGAWQTEGSCAWGDGRAMHVC